MCKISKILRNLRIRVKVYKRKTFKRKIGFYCILPYAEIMVDN